MQRHRLVQPVVASADMAMTERRISFFFIVEERDWLLFEEFYDLLLADVAVVAGGGDFSVIYQEYDWALAVCDVGVSGYIHTVGWAEEGGGVDGEVGGGGVLAGSEVYEKRGVEVVAPVDVGEFLVGHLAEGAARGEKRHHMFALVEVEAVELPLG